MQLSLVCSISMYCQQQKAGHECETETVHSVLNYESEGLLAKNYN